MSWVALDAGLAVGSKPPEPATVVTATVTIITAIATISEKNNRNEI
ncbi:hypothetical protein [Secundilactobacillus oryzae]|nr:hypothetical protein [Secundilactobacillus oryzae]